MMSASEAAGAAGVTTRQLQHWRDIGVLRPSGWVRPPARGSSGFWSPCEYSEQDITVARTLGRISPRVGYLGLRRIIPALRLAIMQNAGYLAVVFKGRNTARVKVLGDAAAVLTFAAAVSGGVLIVEIPR